MLQTLRSSLAGLVGNSVRVSAREVYTDSISVDLDFSGGTKLRFDYWRLVIDGKERVSSFDHNQQYGLPAPVDAIKQLETELQGKAVTQVPLDAETGDLQFQFGANVKLRVFAFSAYEVWEIHFPDGLEVYSNHTKGV